MARTARRPLDNRIYGAQWRKVRKLVLERDEYRCKIRGPKCKGVASTVDHVIPVDAGGAWYDTSNLRAACTACNFGRANKRRRESARPNPSRDWFGERGRRD